jgi:hypothetical protein
MAGSPVIEVSLTAAPASMIIPCLRITLDLFMRVAERVPFVCHVIIKMLKYYHLWQMWTARLHISQLRIHRYEARPILTKIVYFQCISIV